MEKIEQFKQHLLEVGLVVFSIAALSLPHHVNISFLSGMFVLGIIVKKVLDKHKLSEKEELLKKLQEVQQLSEKQVKDLHVFTTQKFNEYQIVINNLAAKENFRGSVHAKEASKARRF